MNAGTQTLKNGETPGAVFRKHKYVLERRLAGRCRQSARVQVRSRHQESLGVIWSRQDRRYFPAQAGHLHPAMRGSEFRTRHRTCLLVFLLGYHPVVKGFLVPSSPGSCASRIDTRLSFPCNPQQIKATSPRPVTMTRASLVPRRAACTKDTSNRRLGMTSSAEVVDFEIHDMHHSSASSSHSETIDAADEDAALRTYGSNVDHMTAAAGVPLSSVTDAVVAQNENAEGGGGESEEFELGGVMRSAVDDFVASAKAAAMTVVPLKRRAKDGRLDIDGQGLLNLVRMQNCMRWWCGFLPVCLHVANTGGTYRKLYTYGASLL